MQQDCISHKFLCHTLLILYVASLHLIPHFKGVLQVGHEETERGDPAGDKPMQRIHERPEKVVTEIDSPTASLPLLE